MRPNAIFHAMPQDSEEWEAIRKGKATSSRFSDIVTPSKLQLSTSAVKYAAELVAERLGIASAPPLPSYHMERGLAAEPVALREFEKVTGFKAERVGFAQLEGVDVGCSPDAVVDGRELVEIKCPKVETLILWSQDRENIPRDYWMQVQGQLWVTGARLCHFWAWHENLEPLHIIVHPDEAVHAAFDEHIPAFMETVERMAASVTAREVTEETFVDTEFGAFNG